MSIPSSNASKPETGRSSALRIHLFGHPSADPEEIAHEFAGLLTPDNPSECDLAIFVINPATGIDPETIAQWEGLNESMVPRLICVTGLDNPQADFDDAVLLANRVFDMTVAPYLVLHDDKGVACALISLEEMKIIDYSTLPATIGPSEPEHDTLVQEFRDEYLAAIDVMGKDGFAAGMLFPAIPLWVEKGIGVDIVKNYISQLESAEE